MAAKTTALPRKKTDVADPTTQFRAKRAREEAFRRWSNPSAPGVDPIRPAAPPIVVDDGVATLDFDSTFRVYTPNELKAARLRSSSLPSPTRLELPPEAEATTALAQLEQLKGLRYQLLQWLALGAGAGLLVLTIFVVIVHAVDDGGVTRAKSSTATTTMIVEPPTSSPPAPTPAPPANKNAVSSDFELPDDSAAASKRALAPTRPVGKR